MASNNERLIAYLDSLGAEPSTPRVREYVLMVVFCVLAAAHLESKSFPVEQAVREAEGCISQYGAGERAMKKKPLECAPMVEAPNHILTYPVAAQ